MGLEGKRVFVRKTTGNSPLYKWTPQTDIHKIKQGSNITTQAEFCTAIRYANEGEDSITKYVTKLETVGNKVKHNAYVECDYVS